MKILDFNINDIITRTDPCNKVNYFDPFTGQQINEDRSYMGAKLQFKCIANGKIYLKRLDPLEKEIFGDRLLELGLDYWCDGWNGWIDPNKLTENYMSRHSWEKLMIEAEHNEDYELMERLRNIKIQS